MLRGIIRYEKSVKHHIRSSESPNKQFISNLNRPRESIGDQKAIILAKKYPLQS